MTDPFEYMSKETLVKALHEAGAYLDDVRNVLNRVSSPASYAHMSLAQRLESVLSGIKDSNEYVRRGHVDTAKATIDELRLQVQALKESESDSMKDVAYYKGQVNELGVKLKRLSEGIAYIGGIINPGGPVAASHEELIPMVQRLVDLLNAAKKAEIVAYQSRNEAQEQANAAMSQLSDAQKKISHLEDNALKAWQDADAEVRSILYAAGVPSMNGAGVEYATAEMARQVVAKLKKLEQLAADGWVHPDDVKRQLEAAKQRAERAEKSEPLPEKHEQLPDRRDYHDLLAELNNCRNALRIFGGHVDTCDTNEGKECDCGFKAAWDTHAVRAKHPGNKKDWARIDAMDKR